MKTCSDVARIRVTLDQVIKEAIKVTDRIQNAIDSISTAIMDQFTTLKDATAQTFAWFFGRFPTPTP